MWCIGTKRVERAHLGQHCHRHGEGDKACSVLIGRQVSATFCDLQNVITAVDRALGGKTVHSLRAAVPSGCKSVRPAWLESSLRVHTT